MMGSLVIAEVESKCTFLLLLCALLLFWGPIISPNEADSMAEEDWLFSPPHLAFHVTVVFLMIRHHNNICRPQKRPRKKVTAALCMLLCS
jgi:hypothetical protein